MVYFEKSSPSPKITSTYNTNEVVDRLKQDFCGKCYICENSQLTSINVEHFVAHRGDKSLKLDWQNLFFACTHCNNLKSDKFNNLLNCTLLKDEVDKAIRYYCDPMPKEHAVFEEQKSSIKTQETIRLLKLCFNGDHTMQKKIESANLRNLLLKEVRIFQELLLAQDNGGDDSVLAKIQIHLNKTSAFTAFKRWIIWDDHYWSDKYGQYIRD